MEPPPPPGRLVSPAPLPVKEPARLTPLAPLVTTVAGRAASGSSPVMFAAATELALAAVPALNACTA